MKKLLPAALLFFLVASPANAYDFGLAGTIAGLAGVGIGLTMMVGALPAVATVAIGAAIMGVTFDPSESTGSPISAQISPSAQLDTPAGWSNASTPPASVALGTIAKYHAAAGQVEYTSAEAAASVSCSTDGGTLTAMGAEPAGTSSYIGQATCSSTDPAWGPAGTIFYRNWSRYPVNECPAGYVVNGGSCAIQTPANVVKPSDAVCGIKRIGNTFSEDAQDPDCANKPATVTVTPNQISQTKPDGSSKTITLNTDGSATLTESRPNTTTNTTETNTTNIGAPDASGVAKVTGQASGATNGTGSAGTSVAVPTFDKTGLATEGTLGGIKADTGAIKDALTGYGADSSLGTEKTAFGIALDNLTGMFGSEPTKSEGGLGTGFDMGGYLPQQCGCTPLTMTIMGHTASYDWCAPMEKFKSALAWVLGIFSAWYCLMLFRVGGSR